MVKKALVAAVVLLLVAAMAYLFLPAWQAHRTLSQVSELQVGKSTFADAQKLAAEMGATTQGTCSATDCSWLRRTDNLSLPHFWAGDGETLSIGFRVQDGVVTERSIAFQLGSGFERSPYADLEERTRWPGSAPPPNPVSVQTQWTPHVARYGALVLMVPAAPPAVRRRYMDFNLNCLWKYGGCSDAGQLLPTVDWKD